MFECIVILIFPILLVTINAQPTAKLWNFDVRDIQQAEAILHEIQIDEVLPFVAFQLKKPDGTYILELPDGINYAIISQDSTRMLNGTTFGVAVRGEKEQIFLCPNSDPETVETLESVPDEKCLAPKKFEGTEVLQCTIQPAPTVRPNPTPNQCGVGLRGVSYSVAYEVCDTKEPYKYPKMTVFLMYQYCYSKRDQKILYTAHYILSTRSLNAKLLYREQTVNFPYWEPQPTQHYNASLQMASNPLYQQQYQLRQIVPHEDMAYGIWRKTAYYKLNLELQHTALWNIWTEINNKVREYAIQISTTNLKFHVITGVFQNGYGIPQDPNGQILNKWVRMIFLKRRDTGADIGGVVILMNNFLNTQDPMVQYVNKELEEFCVDNFCDTDFNSKVESVGGRIRCCRTTLKIGELFNIQTNNNLEVLRIPGLIVPAEF